MNLPAALAVLLAGAGLWMVWTAQVRARDPIRRALAGHPLGAVWRIGQHDRVDAVLTAWDRRIGGALAVLARSVTAHRRRRLQGAAAAAGLTVLIGAAHAATAPLLLAAPAGLLGAVAVDLHLRREAQRHRERLTDQTVDLAELLALAASAGLSVAEGLDRSRDVADPMGTWVRRIVGEVRSGRGLRPALAGARDGMGVPAFARLTQTITTADDLGAPLAGPLLAQARDLRGEGRARRLERAGRAEVAMLVPIVFLILPAVVAVAVYPAVVAVAQW